MAADSKIEWTHHTFNPWEGCAKVSPGCKNCYADARHDRFHAEALGELACWGVNAPRMQRGPNHWKDPLKWNRKARAEGVRKRVFCASLADVFERQSDVSRSYAGTTMDTKQKDGLPGLTYTFADIEAERQKLWKLVAKTPWLDWLLLTKRPENILGMVPPHWVVPTQPFREFVQEAGAEALKFVPAVWPPNVWVGTSTENQEQADLRIPHLLKLPNYATKFISAEPLLGPVDLRNYFFPNADELGLDWVIVGGESGPKAQPLPEAYARDLRDQCAAAGVPFLFKQWGEYLPASQEPNMPGFGGFICAPTYFPPPRNPEGSNVFHKVGKHSAGRNLDGVIHDGYP